MHLEFTKENKDKNLINGDIKSYNIFENHEYAFRVY